MRLFIVAVLVLCAAHTQAVGFPLSQRVSLSERAPKKASSVPGQQAWRLGLLGLAALSFLIRKRL